MTASPGDVFPKGLQIDYDVVAGPDGDSEYAFHNAIQIDYNQADAAIHSNAVVHGKGISIGMDSGEEGIQSIWGIDITVAGNTGNNGPGNFGIAIDAPATYVDGDKKSVNTSHIRCLSAGSNVDYFDISVGTDGVTHLYTNDGLLATANAHINIVPDGKMLILSGTGSPTSFNEADGADVAFYVSGSRDSRGTEKGGSAVFGGDLIVSGAVAGGESITLGFLDNSPRDIIKREIGRKSFGGGEPITTIRDVDTTLAYDKKIQFIRYTITGKPINC